jgi:hypothetical protein
MAICGAACRAKSDRRCQVWKLNSEDSKEIPTSTIIKAELSRQVLQRVEADKFRPLCLFKEF